MVTRVEMEGVNQELEMNAHTLLHVRQRASKDLLCSTGHSTQYSVITYVRKESKKINKCAYITESLCCTPETNTTL